MNYFQNKVVLVTGGAAGIGAELVRQLAAARAAVVVADLHGDAAQRLADELSGAGARVTACGMDVTQFDQVERAVETAIREFGRLDLMFNNAGIGMAGELRDVELADWRPLLDVNLWGVIHGVHAALPVMLRQGAGQIVNISSASGIVPRPGMVPYSTSKHAVVGLSTSLRYEMEDLGIRVNVVCPLVVATGIFKNTKYRNVDGEKLMAAVPLRRVPVGRCVEDILAGVRRNKPVIVLPRFARFEWRMYRLFPRLAARLLLRPRRRLFRAHRLSG